MEDRTSEPKARTPENEVRIRPLHRRDPWERAERLGGLSMAGPAVDLTDPRLIPTLDLRGEGNGTKPHGQRPLRLTLAEQEGDYERRDDPPGSLNGPAISKL